MVERVPSTCLAKVLNLDERASFMFENNKEEQELGLPYLTKFPKGRASSFRASDPISETSSHIETRMIAHLLVRLRHDDWFVCKGQYHALCCR